MLLLILGLLFLWLITGTDLVWWLFKILWIFLLLAVAWFFIKAGFYILLFFAVLYFGIKGIGYMRDYLKSDDEAECKESGGVSFDDADFVDVVE